MRRDAVCSKVPIVSESYIATIAHSYGMVLGLGLCGLRASHTTSALVWYTCF